jgi:hypothetical protein
VNIFEQWEQAYFPVLSEGFFLDFFTALKKITINIIRKNSKNYQVPYSLPQTFMTSDA